jgi:hypothetical protein
MCRVSITTLEEDSAMMLVSSQTQRQWKCGKEKNRIGHKEEKGTTHQKRTKEEEERLLKY